MIKLAINGCHGRMGQRIAELAFADRDFTVTKLIERPDHPKINEKIAGIKISSSLDGIKGCDSIIEFTTPESTMNTLHACVDTGVKLVIGTTGLTENQISEIRNASQKIPIVFSSNMSIGVNILFKLAEQLSKTTPDSYKVKITEAHHIHKKDAPSGTAKTLAQKIERSSSKKVEDIESIREGEIVGDHKVAFESPEDIITIEHHAKNRDIFAKGALVAVKFLANKSNGLFSMQEVLGLA